MSSLQELYEDLRNYSDFEVLGNTEKFLDAVGEILKYQDPSSISILLDYFDDETEYEFVIQGMISGIESYPDEVYIKSILTVIGKGMEKFPGWLTILTYGILNHPDCFKIFKSNIGLASKESLLRLFDLIEQESPQHKHLIDELKKELK